MRKLRDVRVNACLLTSFVLIFLIVLIRRTSAWFLMTFDKLTIEQIIFHLKVSMAGSNSDFLYEYLKGPFAKIVLLTFAIIGTSCVFLYLLRNKDKEEKVFSRILWFTSFSLFLYTLVSTSQTLGLSEYMKNSSAKSEFIEENYVDPNHVKLIFPENKRNLIYIYVESLETTFSDLENGGALNENALGELSELAKEHVHFSDKDTLGGAFTTPGSTWTIAGMVSQSSGLPLKIPIDGNSYGEYSSFLPGIVTIGDILEDEGYNQMIMAGSDMSFGGRSNFYTQHGNYEIFDHISAQENDHIPVGYNEWWGFEDEKLFEFAKAEIMNLSSKDEPFNFTMITADTHHVDGYVTSGMEEPFDAQYKNVILNTSKQLVSFVEWAQQQAFYEDTVIVIVGDHLTMDAAFIKEYVSSDYSRRVFNLIINSEPDPINSNNRIFSTLDFFPTTLSSLGVEIEGERLGLGTNLFSDVETMYEYHGKNEVHDELNKQSKFYLNNFLK